MGGYDVIFPETVTPTDHQGNKLMAPARIVERFVESCGNSIGAGLRRWLPNS